MKKFIIQTILILIVLFTALYFATSKNVPRLLPATSSPSALTKLTINSSVVNVEIADTPDKRKQGLSGRQSLATDSGMLFIFEKADKVGFWMKDMKFALDLIYINDKKVVDIIKNAAMPPVDQKDQDLPIYMAREPFNMVLEVNAGFVDSHSLKVGDMIELKK